MVSTVERDEERVAAELREHRPLVSIAWILLGFGALGLLTSLFLGHVGEPWLEQVVRYRGSNLAGPFEVGPDDPIVNIDAHGGLVADDTWATMRCQILDASGETLFAFRDVIWHAEGWDDDGSWVEWDVTVDLDAVLPPGTYSLAFFIEEAPGTAPRKGRLEEGDIRVELATVDASPVPHRMAGTIAIAIAGLLLVGARFVTRPSPRWLPRAGLVLAAGLYLGLFVLAGAGYGYAGYGGPDRPPSWWDWGAVPTEHGPGAAAGRYPADLDTLTYEDGSLYAGETEDGKPHGTGRWIDASKTRIFGQFRDGRPHGPVIVEYHEGHRWSRYEGTMQGGELDGEGTLWLSNGDKYVGEFAAGAKHGAGTYTFADGRAQAGRWDHDEHLGP